MIKKAMIKCNCIGRYQDCGMRIIFEYDRKPKKLDDIRFYMRVNKEIEYRDMKYHRQYDITVSRKDVIKWIKEIKAILDYFKDE